MLVWIGMTTSRSNKGVQAVTKGPPGTANTDNKLPDHSLVDEADRGRKVKLQKHRSKAEVRLR